MCKSNTKKLINRSCFLQHTVYEINSSSHRCHSIQLLLKDILLKISKKIAFIFYVMHTLNVVLYTVHFGAALNVKSLS